MIAPLARPTAPRATNLTNQAAHDDVCPVWSPDGQRIAFVSDRDGPRDEYHVFTMRPDGTDVTRVSSEPADSYGAQPQWSPDGSRLL
jgi:TolB protein